MRLEWSVDQVVKVAESDEDRHRLEREASVLRAVAHPAIVRVVAGEGPGATDRLCLQRVQGTTLADVPLQPERVIAGWGAAVATVVGDLHDLGFAHGAIAAEHVLIDQHGRPILCGFGRAGRLREFDGDPVEAVDADVRAVARLFGDLLPDGNEGIGRMVRRWAEGRHRHRSDARALAKAFVDQVPDATVRPVQVEPDGETGATRGPVPEQDRERDPGGVGGGRAWGRGRAGGRRDAVVAGVGVVIGVAVAAGGMLVMRPARPAPVAGSSAYLMRSVPGEHTITVVGRWGCGPATAAVLDTRSGSVWTFPAWPAAGGAMTGKFLQNIPGGSGLAAVSDRAACDRLLVMRAGGPDVPVNAGRGG